MQNTLSAVTTAYGRFLQLLRPIDGIAPLLLRLYLAPVFMQAGWNKLVNFESTAAWFGNPEWGLGLPLPGLMTALAAGTEFLGGLLLIAGLGTRVIAIPLAVTMVVAIFAVHWENGWLAVSDASSWLANERVEEAAARKAMAIELLKEHGNYAWLTGRGSITILNNGIEFAVTYLFMVGTLLFTGGGRYLSLDYWVGRRLMPSGAPDS